MTDLSIDDIKALLLDLYIVQRENTELRARLAEYENHRCAPEGREDGEV